LRIQLIVDIEDGFHIIADAVVNVTGLGGGNGATVSR
jgi:hypothetical protein